MPKVHTATKNRGKCGDCLLQVKKGQRYYSFLRHATEKERNDPRVKTISVRHFFGPRVEIFVHEDCKVVLPPST